MADARRSSSAGSEIKTEDVSLIDRMLDKIAPTSEPEKRDKFRNIIAEFADKVMKKEIVYNRDTESTIKAYIAQLDDLISAQLNAVMHAPEFQKLEATWRGLKHLVDQTETGTTLKIKAFNITKKDLLKDLEKASEFDQSALYKKVYEEEYGVFGGSPFGLLVGDYEFGNHPQDITLLEKMSTVAAAAHAPFIAGTDARMFGLESFSRLNEPRDLAKVFESVEYAKWKSFRDSEDSRYVGLCLPHVLMRLPYGRETVPVESFNFEEDVDGRDHHKYLWGNAAWALATRITAAFAQHGWCTAIRGVEGGGLVEGLPTHTFRTDDGDIALKCPTEVQIPERRDKELQDLGFISLVHSKGRDYAAFFGTYSTNRPKVYNKSDATASARLSAQLQYTFAVSRFAHYMKSMMRDKIGSFMSRKNCEDFLNTWIKDYVLLDDDASQEQKAKFPLREASIEVMDIPGKPGAYRAVANLRPHFQLDELDVALRLVADLPSPKK